MAKEIDSLITELEKLEVEIYRIKNIISALYVDLQSTCPEDGKEERSEQLSYLTGIVHEKVTAQKFQELIEEIKNHSKFSTLEQENKRKIELWSKEVIVQTKLPPEFVQELEFKRHATNTLWSTARESGEELDKQSYIQSLKELFELNMKEYEYVKNYFSFECAYDYFLDKFEEGLTSSVVDTEFKTIKEEIISIFNSIEEQGISLDTKTVRYLDDWKLGEKEQRELVEYVFELLSLTSNKFTYFVTHHPFMIPLSPNDTRLGVAFRNSPLFSLTSGSHEAGHAVYESNMGFKNSILGEGPSMGIHESQSLFWESHVMSSEQFLHKFYETIQKKSNGYLDSIDFQTFYKYYNHITKSLIRIEGDELTYPLHIIIRYEIERDLFNGVISFDELEREWNNKYKEYFNKEPKNIKEGFMQDVHWSEGMFGYFPTYLIGRIYASQVEKELRERLPQFEEYVSNHSFDEILKVLKENIYSIASLKTTPQIFQDFTNSKLDSSIYINYLKKKYYEMYEVE